MGCEKPFQLDAMMVDEICSKDLGVLMGPDRNGAGDVGRKPLFGTQLADPHRRNGDHFVRVFWRRDASRVGLPR
jgi:hypothetical protein